MVVEGWAERPRKVMSLTPPNQLIDYKLLWRDPLPTWSSKFGRMLLVGESAHPFLPSSGQGAAQAIEDAATIAICLELAGKDRVPLAVKTSEKIRYPNWVNMSNFVKVCQSNANPASWGGDSRCMASNRLGRI
jgi:2-polyprenyl-6-methoxyphenol hydroxylase-like FAD-dependent oxidoreductase